MRCSSCDSIITLESNFCDVCGARIVSQCPQCGADNRAGANYCRNCGERLAAEGVNEPKKINPSQSNAIDSRMDTSGRVIAEERKRVTVLFADIRGSTAFIEKVDPEEVRRYFDPVLRVMMDAV